MITTHRVGVPPLTIGLKRPTAALRFGQHPKNSAHKLLNNPLHHYPPFLKALNQPYSKISQEELVSTILALKAEESKHSQRTADTQRMHHEMADVLMAHVYAPTSAHVLQTTLQQTYGPVTPVHRARTLLQMTAKKASESSQQVSTKPTTAANLLNPDSAPEWTHYIQWLRDHKGQERRNQSLLEMIPAVAEQVRTTWVFPKGERHDTHFLLQAFNILVSHVDNAPLAKKIVKHPQVQALFLEKPDAVNPILKNYLTKYTH